MFAVELCAYGILANHYHLVLRLAPEKADTWSQTEVLDRWEKLYGIATPIAIGLAKDADPAQRALAKEIIEVRRQRLSDLSWFMKYLNEFIARKANLEGQCTGHFWQSRYQSPALLDEKALLTCMAYVDLNPIRARWQQPWRNPTTPQSRPESEQLRVKPPPCH